MATVHGYAAIPDDYAFSRRHFTSQLWYPALENAQHLADTQGRVVAFDPTINQEITSLFSTISRVYYYDATAAEETHLTVAVQYGKRAEVGYLNGGAATLTCKTDETSGAHAATNLDGLGSVTDYLPELTLPIQLPRWRCIGYPSAAVYSLVDWGTGYRHVHKCDAALPAAGRRITITVTGSVALVLRSITVVAHRAGGI